MLSLLLFVACVCSRVLLPAEGMPDGPVVPDSCVTLTPQHMGTSQQEDSPPTDIRVNGVDGGYIPGAGTTLTGTVHCEYLVVGYHCPTTLTHSESIQYQHWWNVQRLHDPSTS